MQQTGAFLLAAAMAFSAAAIFPEADAAGINHRQYRQASRIGQGVKSGVLTGQEAKSLLKAQRNFNRKEQRYREDGLTRQERLKLQASQDRLSKKIYRQKHDNQTR